MREAICVCLIVAGLSVAPKVDFFPTVAVAAAVADETATTLAAEISAEPSATCAGGQCRKPSAVHHGTKHAAGRLRSILKRRPRFRLFRRCH